DQRDRRTSVARVFNPCVRCGSRSLPFTGGSSRGLKTRATDGATCHMLWALFWIQIAFVVLGFFLLWQGLRRRYSDDHPHCRKCGYDLYGLVSGTKLCPECGAELRRRGAIQIGVPRRRWGLVVVAVLCGGVAWGVVPLRRVAVMRWVHRPKAFLYAIKTGDDRAVEELLTAEPHLIKLRPAGQSLLDMAVAGPS